MSRRSSSKAAAEPSRPDIPLRNGKAGRVAVATGRTIKAGRPQGNGLFSAYMVSLGRIVSQAAITDAKGRVVELELAVKKMGRAMSAAHARGNRIFFVGNGGSAGICSHMATDYSKNGGIRASALNDGAVLTCLGNDFGYEHVFSKQLEWHAREGDILVAISSSGKSKNILNAVDVARGRGCQIFTFSGFGDDNPLRLLGDLNIYLASHVYGFVEIGHESILHGVLDIQMGWTQAEKKPARRQSARASKLNGAAI